jgi:hypothetical protein
VFDTALIVREGAETAAMALAVRQNVKKDGFFS